MTNLSDRVDQLSSSQRLLLAMKEARTKLEAVEHSKTEPIAIIGMGCRFPGGANNPQAFWQLLSNGVDAITQVPPERWDINAYYDPNPGTPGKMCTRYGGFLQQVDSFDAQFFGISPREAISLDPQQRLLLEVSWEALENAAVIGDRLSGSQTGVFVGITTNDYIRHLMQFGSGQIDGYLSTGNALNAAAGRLSYTLGLMGPCMALDTACSSSLVAIHVACQSLRNQECRQALAGGVNLTLAPETTIALSQARMISKSGRCKTFDASADGIVRGEGCGMLVLKRLSDAIGDRDNILALIRSSAVNQDGLSSGFTVPNKAAQEILLRIALARAKVEASDVDYVEAHGTGTSLGDPIELRALGAVLGEGRTSEHPLLIGSVKTNIGHTESAAGVAGAIKVVLSMQHGQLPPHLHFHQPNPHINWDELPVSVTTKLTPWAAVVKPRIAGVSAFGASGTNAHLVLEEAPKAQQNAESTNRPLHLLTLSAKTNQALVDLAQRYEQNLTLNPTLAVEDICFTSNTGRSHFNYRLSVLASTTKQIKDKLAASARTQQTSGVIQGVVEQSSSPKVAFLFTGQGSQYVNMGRQLYETQPTFRKTLDSCDEIVRPYLEKSLLCVLYPETGMSSPLEETAYTQPALFALEYALAQLWQSWGIEPGVVMGHSVGEYVAATVAGVFSLEDGLKLIAQRGQLMQKLPPDGQMLAVFADQAQVAKAIQPYTQDVSIAAINSPQNLVISGKQQALEAVRAALTVQGIETQPLKVSHAFHSPLMEPILDALEVMASQISFQAPCIPLISNLTGDIILPESIPDAKYWRNHSREAVRFVAGMKTLFDRGCDIFLEIGPKPVLLSLGKRCLPEVKATWLPSLVQEQNDWQVLLESLSTLYVRGASINWTGFDKDYSRNRLSLPTYPFQRKRYWFEEVNLHVKNLNNQKVGEKESELQMASPPKTTRRDTLVLTLSSLVGNSLRVAQSEVEIHTPFLEMGADSIVLMETLQSIENTYGIKITIRQLFEELTTINRLANYIDQNLSPEWISADSLQSKPEPELQMQQSDEPTTAIASAGSRMHNTQDFEEGEVALETGLERVMRQQLQIMSQQLEILGGKSQSPANVPSSDNGSFQSAHHPAEPVIHFLQGGQQNQVAEAVSFSPKIEPEQKSSKPFLPLPSLPGVEDKSKGLNSKQQRYLEALVARYTNRTQKSKQQAQAYRQVLADSRAVAGFRLSIKEMLYPIVGERAQGSRLWDVDGNEYVDITMGFGVLLFGHAAPFIVEALEEQIKLGIQIGPQSNLAGEVAQLICELSGMERVTFCNSGTEAVMTALRLARTASGRTKIALFSNSYHGHFDGVLATASKGQLDAVPMVPGVCQQTVKDVLVLDYDNPKSIDILQAHAHELAAVVVEPVQSRQPELQPKEFLHRLRQLTQAAGTALIFDEVLTGFRIHPGGAQAWFGIEADIAIYGKIVGGGMPIGVVAGKATYMNGIDGGLWNYGDSSYPQAEKTFFAGTFNKNHMGMAVARAVLKHLKKQGYALQQQLNQRTSHLAETLNTYFKAENLPICIVHFGSLFRFSFSGNLDLLFYHLLEKGVYIWEGRNCFISTAHTDADIDYVIQAVKDSVENLREGGFLPEARRKLQQ